LGCLAEKKPFPLGDAILRERLALSPDAYGRIHGSDGNGMRFGFPMIHGAGVACIYIAMLRKLPLESVREFWQAHPLRIGKDALPERELYQYLWSYECRLPADYYATVRNDFEPFVNGLGLTLGHFEDALRWEMNRTMVIGGALALDWLQPFFRDLFLSDDPMLVGLKSISRFFDLGFPGCGAWQLRFDEDGQDREFFVGFAPDKDFRYTLRYDILSYASALYGSFPCLFGLPAPDRMTFHADCRRIQEILGQDWESRDGTLRINGERFGHVVLFSRFCESMGFDFGGDSIPNPAVLVLERDYYCPIRQRIMLLEGCAYGAPCYIASWKYRKDYPRPGNYLESLALEASRGAIGERQEIEGIHRQLLAESAAKLAWVYNRERGQLEANGRRMFIGAQARLLKGIIQAHLNEGAFRFDFRRFKQDPDVSDNPKRSNLEIHLKRISLRLDRARLGLRLCFPERGRFQLHIAAGGMELSEA
jgi:hypothetical protein